MPTVPTYVWYVWAGQDGEEFRARFFNAVAFYSLFVSTSVLLTADSKLP